MPRPPRVTDPGAGSAAEQHVQPLRARLRRRPVRAVRGHPGRGRGQRTVFELRVAVPLRGRLRAAAPARHQRRRPQRHGHGPHAAAARPRGPAQREPALDPQPSTRPTTPACAAWSSSAFTVRRIEQLRGRVRALVGDLLDDLAPRAPRASPSTSSPTSPSRCRSSSSPRCSACPTATATSCGPGRTTMTRSLEPFIDAQEPYAARRGADQMLAHVDDAIEWKRDHPADDLLTRADRTPRTTATGCPPRSCVDQVVLLYLAGHETTVNLIGNGTLALLRHRDQLERLAADPSLDANAVDELLRYDSPVQLSRRIALDRLEVGGVTIDAGHVRPDLPGLGQPRPGHVGRRRRRARPRAAPAPHATCRSAAASTTASAPRWPASRAPGASRPLVRRFPDIELATDAPAGTAASSCAASTACR